MTRITPTLLVRPAPELLRTQPLIMNLLIKLLLLIVMVIVPVGSELCTNLVCPGLDSLSFSFFLFLSLSFSFFLFLSLSFSFFLFLSLSFSFFLFLSLSLSFSFFLFLSLSLSFSLSVLNGPRTSLSPSLSLLFDTENQFITSTTTALLGQLDCLWQNNLFLGGWLSVS